MVTINKLLELAKVPTNEKARETLDEVQRFVLAVGLKEGKHVIDCTMIYKAFSMWRSRPTKTSISFFTSFGRFFKGKRTGTHRYYLLNLRPLELLNRVDNMKIKKN